MEAIASSGFKVSSQNIIERLERLPFTRFHWILILTIFIGTAFDNMDQITLSYVIPVYAKEWGLDPLTTRWNPIFGLGGTLIGALLWGRIADRTGRRNAFLYTLLIFAGTSLLNGFVPHDPVGFWIIVASCFFMGIGVGGEIPLAFALISEYTPAKHRGRVEILTGMLAISGGYAISAAAASVFLPFGWGTSFLGIPLGWRTLFTIGVIPAIMGGWIRRAIPESPRYLLSKGKMQEALRVVEGIERQAGIRTHLSEAHEQTQYYPDESRKIPSMTGIFGALYRRKTTMTTLYGVSWGFFNFGFLTWLPSLLEKRAGISASEVALFASIMNAIAIPSAFVSAILFEKWSTKKTLALYPLMAGVLMIVLGQVAGSGLLTPLTLITLGSGIFFTGASLAGAFPPYASEVYPTELRGTGGGWATSLSRLGSVIGIAAGGALLAGQTGILEQQLVFGVPLLFAGGIMLILGIETSRKRLEEISSQAGV